MRICIGGIILLDLIHRAASLGAHYGDLGVLPRADAISLSGNKFFISLHMISGLPLVQGLLFLTAGVFAIMLMIGYHTRLSAIASWVLLLSLQARNPMVLQGADIVLRITLFWMLFLPISSRWSLDKILGRIPKPRTLYITSVATFAYLIQIGVFYLFTGILKTGTVWHDGTALYYALSVDQLVRPFGRFILSHPVLSSTLTYFTIYLETYGAALFFIPWKRGFFQMIGVLLFAIFQFGANISFHLGLFGPIAIAATLGILPPYFWDSVVAPLRKKIAARGATGLAIYYDGDCGFCKKIVLVIRKVLFLSPSTITETASSENGALTLLQEKNSWVVRNTAGQEFFGFRALSEVFRYSPVFFWLAYPMQLPGVRNIGEWIYRKVAQSRLQICLPEDISPEQETARNRVLRIGKNALILFLTGYVVLWNVGTAGENIIPRSMEWIGLTTRLDQSFNMFAPAPLIDDGWYVIPATLSNGKEINLFKNGPMLSKPGLFPVSYEKPDSLARMYPDQRWQKYLMNIAEKENSKYRLDYGKYLCRIWNANHTGGEKLLTFKMMFMLEQTPAPGTPETTVQPMTLWQHRCFENIPPPTPENVAPPTKKIL